jgi:ribokinase
MISTPDVVVLGAHGCGGNLVHIDHVPVPGESIIAKDFRFFKDGGKGSHQALVIGRLGGKSAFIGKLPNGLRSDAAIKWLVDEGVDVRHLLRQGEESPHAGLIMLDKDGVSTIVSIPGPRHALTFEEVKPRIEDFRSARMFITGFEIPVETALQGAQLAKRLGMTTILNPAPISAEPLGVLDYIDIAIPNEAEARGMAGVDLRARIAPRELAAMIRDKCGIKTIIITLGGEGVYALDGEKPYQIDALPVHAVNTTGAGDAFIGGFAWALLSGKDMSDALAYANCAAGISVSREGSIDSFPTRGEIEQFMHRLAAGRTH